MALLFYTNFTSLSYNFSSSFRAIKLNEKYDDIKERNSYWANMTRLIAELVNCYGEKIKNVNPKNNTFFPGVSMIYFDKFHVSFLQPTSTTKQLAVAQLFAKESGLILELYKGDKGNDRTRYFNCS